MLTVLCVVLMLSLFAGIVIPTVRLGKPSKLPADGALSLMGEGDTGTIQFNLIDHGDYFRVQGYDLATGLPISISSQATVVPSSADPTIVAVQSTGPTTFRYTPLKAGTVDLTAVVTYTNGKSGPCTITIPITVVGTAGVELQSFVGTVSIA